jgi:hypothetical protein
MDAYLAKLAEQGMVPITDAAFLKANASNLEKMKKAIQQLNKASPDTKAAQQASAIGEKYGLSTR